MTNMTKAILLNSCAFVVCLATPQVAFAAAEPAPAPADAAAADDSGAPLAEIIVTAQKRSENLQSTPIAISVLKGDDLRA